MPIPTDTFWNIKRLNIVFAASAVILMAVMGWATFQDFNQAWRAPQREGKVWEAAFVDQRIQRDDTPEKEAELARLQKELTDRAAVHGPDADETKKRQATLRQLVSDQSNMEFAYNTLKAEVTVQESLLQDAITNNDKDAIRAITQKLEGPRKKLAGETEALAAKKEAVANARADLAQHTKEYDAIAKQITKLQADVEGLKKKKAALVPQSLLAKGSNMMRETPLMQFINPATRVKQVVLQDVRTSLGGVKEVETIDRCVTCHVNIDNKDFAEAKVLAYLEEQVAASRDVTLPAVHSGRAADAAATRVAPGAVAMPEFWHLWAATAAPDLVKRPAALTRLNTIAATVGKQATVTVDGKKLAAFAYVPDPKKPEHAASSAMDQRTRDLVMGELIRAWIAFGAKPQAAAKRNTRVQVKLAENLDEKAVTPIRLPAMKYVEDVKPLVLAALPPEKLKLLNDRYRRAMVAEANVTRRQQGLHKLNDSPVMLAHPRLDLYVDIDSRHPAEQHGCTSCHDGSGQETHFVLTAHTPRPIWVDQKTGEPVLPEQIDPKSASGLAHHDEDLSSMLNAVWREDSLTPAHVSDLHLALAESSHHGSDAKSQAASTRPATAHAAHAPEAHAAPTSAPATARSGAPATPNVGATATATTGASPTTAPSTTTAHANGAHASDAHAVPEEPAADAVPVTYVDPVTGNTGKAVSQMQYWVRTYEPTAPRSFALVYHEWDWPMRPPRYLQANCVRCHNDVNSIKHEAPKVFEGRSLFVNQGCVNCHQMDSIPAESAPEKPSDLRLIVANGQRKVGTDLRNITAKLSPSFINAWIWAPKSFRPSTKMPHFFLLENNSSDEEIRRTRQEARAITEYLVRTATPHVQTGAGSAIAQAGDAKPQGNVGPLPPQHVIPAGAKGSADAGRTIFASIGCQGCHTNLNDPTGERRNNKPVTLAEKWIVTDLVKGGPLARQMTSQLGKAPDARALSTRAAEMYDRMSYNERQLYISENLGPSYAADAALKYPDNTPKPIFQNHGPELSGIGTKLTAGRSPQQARQWLYDWLKNPRNHSEYTVMPDLRLSDQQAIDLVEYLLAQQRTNDKPDDPWKAELTEVDSPKLIELTSLFLRSRFSAQKALEKADEDAELTALAADSLTTAHVPAEQAKSQAAKLTRDEKRMVFLGKKLISHYGCMSCHAINGAENLSSPCANLSDWGQKGLDKLDFGFLDHHKAQSLPAASNIPLVNGLSDAAANLTSPEYRSNFSEGHVAAPVKAAWPHVGHSRTDWLTQKLRNTRAYDRGKVLLEPSKNDPGKPYDKLKMPTFYLNDREVDAIVTWVISNRDRLISHKLKTQTVNEEAQRVTRGRQLVQKFNCAGCHVVEGNAPSVHQFYKDEEIPTKAPPSLRGEGNKIQHAWLFNFLKHVEPLRPLLANGIRMPSFHITDDEATAIAAYFAAVSHRESQQMTRDLLPVRTYMDAQRKALAATRPALATQPALPTARIPGDDWFTRPEFSAVVAKLRRWALDNKQIAELQLDPARNKPDELARNWRTILFKVEFVERLYDAPYPFMDTPRLDNLSEARFKLGEKLFYEMACLQCHVLGDANVPGAQKNPTAPNLTLTHRRLQRRWVRHWVQEPPIIQVQTAMPPFFSGLSILDPHGQSWPRAQQGTVRPADQIEAEYGKTADEQIALLMDFLYAAGARGYTGVQPAAAAPAGTPAVQQRNPAQGVKPTPPPTATQPMQPGDATKGTPAEAPGAPSPKSPQDAKTPPGQPGGVEAPRGAPVAPPPSENAEPKAQPKAGASADADAAKPQATAVAPAAPAPAPAAAAPAPVPAAPAAPAPAAPAPAAGDVAIKGVVLLDGKAPQPKEIDMAAVGQCAGQHADPVTEQGLVANDKGQLQNVVLTITSGLPQQEYPPPAEPAVLDQKGCMYTPHVLPVMVGQKIVARNSDPFMHNVHTLPGENVPENFAQPNVGDAPMQPLKTAEVFRVKCDVHPWMSAYIVGAENPFFAVTGDDGAFAIPGKLPPGEYTLKAWHETLGTKEVPVKVEAGKPAQVEIKFAAP